MLHSHVKLLPTLTRLSLLNLAKAASKLKSSLGTSSGGFLSASRPSRPSRPPPRPPPLCPPLRPPPAGRRLGCQRHDMQMGNRHGHECAPATFRCSIAEGRLACPRHLKPTLGPTSAPAACRSTFKHAWQPTSQLSSKTQQPLLSIDGQSSVESKMQVTAACWTECFQVCGDLSPEPLPPPPPPPPPPAAWAKEGFACTGPAVALAAAAAA